MIGQCLAPRNKYKYTVLGLVKLTPFEKNLMKDRRFTDILYKNKVFWSSVKDYNLNVTVETQEDDSKWRDGQILKPGDIILTTNLGGRGTDYKIEKEASDHGGLFVLITFSPDNERVYRQAKGRCGRSGQPGTCQIISKLPIYYQKQKQILNKEAKKTLDFSLKKDELFEKVFLPNYQRVMKNQNERSANGQFEGPRLRDRFAFLMDELEQTCIRESKDPSTISIEDFESKLTSDESFDNPLYLVLQANHFLNCSKFDWAIEDFKLALDKDDKLCGASAYLNLALAYLKEKGGKCKVTICRDDLIGYFEKALACNKTQIEKCQLLLAYTINNDMNSKLAKQIQSCLELYDYYAQVCAHFIKNLESFEADSEVVLKIEDLPFKGQQKQAFDEFLEPDGFLPYFFSLEEKKAWKLSWSAVAVTAMGALFLTLGCLATMTGFVNVGQALIAEGVNDLLHGAIAIWKGEKITLKDYLTNKLISIAISAVTFGIGKTFSAIKNVYNNGFKHLKTMATSAKASVTSMFQGAKSVLTMSFKQGALKEGWKKFGFEVIKSTFQSFATNLSSRAIGFGVNQIFDWINETIEAAVKNKVKEKLTSMRNVLAKLEAAGFNGKTPASLAFTQAFFHESTQESAWKNYLWQFLDKFTSEMSARIRTPLTRYFIRPRKNRLSTANFFALLFMHYSKAAYES